jgi:protein-S-isoprenylcysteine O-methyltransferase Ste14
MMSRELVNVQEERTTQLLAEKKGEHPLGDLGQLVLLVLFLVVWVCDSFLLHESTFLAGYVPLPLRLLAAGLMLLTALPLYRSGHRAVPSERRAQEVLTDGAFNYVRHPLYLAGVLTYLAMAASTLSLLSLALIVPIFIFYDHIASYEEKLLLAKFGERYSIYRGKTGKWLPVKIRWRRVAS